MGEERRVAVELAEEPARRRQRRVQVVERQALLLGLPDVLRGGVLEERLDRGPRRRVERVEQLVEVDRRGRLRLRDRPAALDRVRLALRLGPRREVELDVAVRDPRLRRLPDHGLRALGQRLVRVVDRHRDLGLAGVGQLDAVDRARRRAADLDLVADYELAGVLEVALDGVAAATPEQQDREDDDRDDHCADRCDAPRNAC